LTVFLKKLLALEAHSLITDGTQAVAAKKVEAAIVREDNASRAGVELSSGLRRLAVEDYCP
jgi:hypothetical protein